MKGLSFLNKVVFAINILVVGLLLLACVYAFIPFQFVRVFSILSLVVPGLFLLNFLFLLYWLLKRKRKFVYSLLAIILGYLSFGHFYGLNASKEKSNVDSELKIMSYNTWGFNGNGWIKKPGIGDSIVEFIKKQDPSILVVQEHSRIRHRQLRQFPYRSETPYKERKSIQAIFSKFPIINSGSLNLPDTSNNIIYADIVFETDTIRVYNLHLQSFRVIPSSDTFTDSEKSEKLLRRVVGTFSQQLEQVKIFREHLNKSPYRNVICGDFNNTQFSNVYKMVKGDMEDTFLEKGSGFGRTYDLKKFPLRIDYIMADPNFEVLSHQNFDVKLSDHYPIMATLRLPSHE